MKTATRQYAKRQVKWIRSKLLPAVHSLQDADDVTVVLLDASGESISFSIGVFVRLIGLLQICRYGRRTSVYQLSNT